MKQIPSGFLDRASRQCTSFALYLRIVRGDGLELGFTTHDKTITISGVQYVSGQLSLSAVSTDDGLSLDNTEIDGLWDMAISSTSLTAEDLRLGLYDRAEVWVYRADWAQQALTPDIDESEQLFRGRFGEVEINRDGFKVEVRDFTGVLHQTIGELTSPKCRAALGDARCGVKLKPASWAGSTAYSTASTAYDMGDSVSPAAAYNGKRAVCTVSGTSASTEPAWPAIGNTIADGTVTWMMREAWTKEGAVSNAISRSRFYDASRSEADNWFTGGILTWTSGLNNGSRIEVKRNLLIAGEIQLVLPMPYDIATSDTYEIEVGCNHARDLSAYNDGLGDCVVKFNDSDVGSNIVNFRGEPDIPGISKIINGQGSS